MDSCDCIIVGGGLAGALLAYSLDQKGQKVVLYSYQQEGESTRVSSGLVNPVTGMRFVKTWNIEMLLDCLETFYRGIESSLDIQILFKTEIIVRLENAAEENAWLSRSGDKEYQQWISSEDTFDEFKDVLVPSLSMGKIKNAWRVDIQGLMNALYQYFERKGIIRNEILNYNELVSHNKGWRYVTHVCANNIVFCEGFRIAENPYFNWLPVYALKGEHTIAEIDGIEWNDVIHGHYSLIPWKDNTYWLGANYQVKDILLNLTPSEKENQKQFLELLLLKPIRIIDHDYGIRPASRDRKPIVGEHPEFKRLYVMNGFGTKGTSLAPYCVSQLVDLMIENTNISAEIDVKRFVKKGYYKNN